MGNRAVITGKDNKLSLYLQWNGGRDSVEGFLKYAKMKGVRGIESDSSYCVARLAQIIGNFFGGNNSIGILQSAQSPGDNGIYVIDDSFNIVDRVDYSGEEQSEYSLLEMLNSIDERQPEEGRLGEEKIEKLFEEMGLDDDNLQDEYIIYGIIDVFDDFTKTTISKEEFKYLSALNHIQKNKIFETWSQVQNKNKELIDTEQWFWSL